MLDINWTRVGLGAAVVVILSVLQLQLMGTQQVMQRVITRTHEIEYKLTESQTRVYQLEQAVSMFMQEEKSKTKSLSTDKIIERFDPQTGVLVQRERSVTKTKTVQKTKTEKILEAKQKVEVVEVATKQADVKELTKEQEVVTVNDSRTGFAGGLLITSSGVGPATSYGLISIQNKANLDLVVGSVVVNGIPDPKAGLAISGEVLPRLTLGAGGFLTGPGEKLGAYHPTFPVIGITPGITIQYRF